MSRKQIGFGILVALIVALFAVLISVFQLNAEVCFTLFALAAPIYLVGRLVESKRLELAGLGSAIVAFGMSGTSGWKFSAIRSDSTKSGRVCCR